MDTNTTDSYLYKIYDNPQTTTPSSDSVEQAEGNGGTIARGSSFPEGEAQHRYPHHAILPIEPQYTRTEDLTIGGDCCAIACFRDTGNADSSDPESGDVQWMCAQGPR